MALQLLTMLSLATGAVNVAQKALASGSGKGGFDEKLAAALTGETGSESSISQTLLKDGELDTSALQALLGTPAGVLLCQLMTSMKEMGIPTSDIQLLVSGDGSQISDDALKTLLSQQGLSQDEISAVFADADLVNGIKTQLGDAFTSMIETQAGKDGVDSAALLELAASDTTTIDELVARLEDAGTAASQLQAAAQENSDSLISMVAGILQTNSSQAASGIKAMVGQVLKEAGVALPDAADQSDATAANGVQAKVGDMLDTAQNTLGISKEELKSLFFETDPELRKETVESVSSKVSAYLKTQEGKTLSSEVTEALSFLKTAMSDTEFAGIDQSLELWNGGQAVRDLNIPVDKDTFSALAKTLGNGDAQSQFDNQLKQVVDQLKQTLPSQMKSDGGHVTIKLNPPMLGQVNVSMTMHEGELQATFKTDQLLTRDMLVQNMNVLKEALADQGIKATQFSVSMSFDQKQQGNGFAFAHPDKGNNGSGQAGSGQDRQGRAIGDGENAVYAQARYSGAIQGGLDLFA